MGRNGDSRASPLPQRRSPQRPSRFSSFELPNHPQVDTQDVDPRVGIGHSKIGMVGEIPGDRERLVLAELVTQAKLGEPVEREILPLPAGNVLRIGQAGAAADFEEQRRFLTRRPQFEARRTRKSEVVVFGPLPIELQDDCHPMADGQARTVLSVPQIQKRRASARPLHRDDDVVQRAVLLDLVCDRRQGKQGR